MEEYKKKKIAVDLFGFFKAIKQDKKMMALFCGLGIILGVAIALDTPKEYTSSVMLAPESSNSGSLTSNISSLASMVGMDMKFGEGEDAIYPELYPDLMQSTDFLVSLFPVKVETIDKRLSTDYYDYMANHQKVSWYEYPALWLTAVVQKFISEPPSATTTDSNGKERIDPFRLTKRQFNIMSKVSKNIECNVDKKTSVITIEVTDRDPLIAATLADSVKQRLQAFITDYRTNKSRADLLYTEKLFNEAKSQYVKARQQYASYSDANQELILESYKSKQEDLENEMQLKYNIYTQMSEQLQLSRAKVQERTPAFTVVQSASVPVKHSSKSKASTVLTWLFLAFLLRVIILIWKKRRMIFHIVEA